MRILYAGTGAIAVPLLEALSDQGLVRAVLTAPDAPGKRGKALIPSPVKTRALELGLEVYQPETLRTEARARVSELGADTLLSFCYGKIFGPKFLSLFDKTFNVHPSLLPKYRGCSPVYAAIKAGDRETAITVQSIVTGVDEGDVYASLPISLDGTETADSLELKVADLASSFVPSVLSSLPVPHSQEGEPSYSSFVLKSDGKIDFSSPWASVHAQIRACYPWPKAYALLDGEVIFITGVYGSAFSGGDECSEEPGTIISFVKGKGLKIAAGDGCIYATKLLPPMRKEMDAASFVNGFRSAIGKRLE